MNSALSTTQTNKYQPTTNYIRLSSYCTAFSYDINKLQSTLEGDGYLHTVYEGVIHIKKNIVEDALGGDIFYFPYGCIIMWGFNAEDAYKELKYISSCQIKPYGRDYQDIMNYKYGTRNSIDIIEEEDLVVLNENNEILVKLSFSYALSQSAKLHVVEESGIETIKRSHYLVDELVSNGKISISQKKLGKKIGMLFAERNSINMHADILDTPEFFWRRAKYLPIYNQSANFLDISTRTEIVNRRSNMVHDLFNLLSTELQHKHSNRLEWIVITLIAIEVVISIGSIISKLFGYA